MAQASVEPHIADFTSRFEREFEIRAIADIDPDAMARFNIELYKDEFNASRYQDPAAIRAFWEWKYKANPAAGGVPNHGWVAVYKGELVGQFHIMPVDVKIGTRHYRCAWGSDLAIIGRYRSLGVSAFLIRKAREDAGKQFALLLLGGMNLNSYNVFKNSGFIDFGKVPRYIKPLDPAAILARHGIPKALSAVAGNVVRIALRACSFSVRGPSSSGMRIVPAGEFGSKFDRLWDSVAGCYTCVAKRDAAFLAWRYGRSNLWPYTVLTAERRGALVGFIVLRDGEVKNGWAKGLAIGVVSDIMADPSDKESICALLDAATEHFKARKAALVKCDAMNCALERQLQAAGFIGIPPANEFMLNAYPENISAEDSAMAESRRYWLITSGDSDLDFD